MKIEVRIAFLLLTLFFTWNIKIIAQQEKASLADDANPFIGVLDVESNCTIGPQLPFGSVNPGPQTPEGQHDGYSPVQPIRGFGQLHVSGTGWGKYGQFLVSPQTGLDVRERGHDSPKSGEIAKIYGYSVNLDRYHIKTELTPSRHAVIYRFTFPKTQEAHIIIDITHCIVRDIATNVGGTVHAGNVQIDTINKDKITGYGRYSGGFGDGEYNIYFCAQFSKQPKSFGTWLNDSLQPNFQTSLKKSNDRIGAYLKFDTSEDTVISMKIAISLKSVEQAQFWLGQEIPAWDFDRIRQNAKDVWDKELGKIIIEGGSAKDKTLFYSALYRSMMMPRDRTNDIEGWPVDKPLWDDHYAIWDTWRTVFPLMTLINPDMVRDNVNSFIERYEKNKVVKDAFVAGIDMFREQGGNNIDNVIADAYVKGVKGIDWAKAYAVIKADADNQRLGLQESSGPMDSLMASYKTSGWIPAGKMSCSISLEYAYNDYCVAEVAKGLGKDADYQKYFNRSQKWTALWNPNLESKGFKGFIGPKKADDTWIDIDATYFWGSWNDYFYEANAWTYLFFVPHDFTRLMEFCGGAQKFADRLNFGFANNLIDYWNEPAFLAVQAFHVANRPDLAHYWIRKMMTEKYTEKGYPGNEDSGAMGSWYVFAALGIFPNAGQPFYYLNRPSFPKITILLGNGKKLVIKTQKYSPDNGSSWVLNGRKLKGYLITHAQLMQGGTLEFKMGTEPIVGSK